MKRLQYGGVIQRLHVSDAFALLFHRLSTFAAFTRGSRQSSSSRLGRMLLLLRPIPTAGRSPK